MAVPAVPVACALCQAWLRIGSFTIGESVLICRDGSQRRCLLLAKPQGLLPGQSHNRESGYASGVSLRETPLIGTAVSQPGALRGRQPPIRRIRFVRRHTRKSARCVQSEQFASCKSCLPGHTGCWRSLISVRTPSQNSPL